jgi:hypothetical protein
MITSISIENFKGIGQRVDLNLRPLTLLFGANSAGKSTILHALHYAREVFERHNLNADQTIAGGPFVDLGGFQNFVHKQNLDTPVKISFDLDLEETGLPDYGTPPPPGVPYEEAGPLVRNVKKGMVLVTISWSRQHSAPYVSEYVVWLDEHWIGTITQEPGRVGCSLCLNLNHPSVVSTGDDEILMSSLGADPDRPYPALSFLFGNVAANNLIPGFDLSVADDGQNKCFVGTVALDGQKDALPHWDRRLQFSADLEGRTGEELRSSEITLDWILETASQLMVGPGQLVRDALLGFRYLGPLRETPNRDHVPPRFPDPSRWASGLGAWDTLENAEENFVETVSHWLGDRDRMNAGYYVRKKEFKELDLANPLVLQLLTGRAFDDLEGNTRLSLDNLPTRSRIQIVPANGGTDSSQEPIELQSQDVGIGISQVVPVIVTALDGSERLVTIEQPELHLHPRLQANLADLFIEAALGDRRHLLILETHSELIPLRLMRRIRETAEGTLPSHLPHIRAEDVAIYYVELHEGATIATHLALGKQGQLLDPWPDGFFEEGYRERFSE